MPHLVSSICKIKVYFNFSKLLLPTLMHKLQDEFKSENREMDWKKFVQIGYTRKLCTPNFDTYSVD